MSQAKLDLSALKADGFIHANRATLNRAHESLFGYFPEKEESIEAVRAACIREAGAPTTPTSLPPVIADVAVTAVERKAGRIPNLTPYGKWEGRARRITLYKVADTSPNEKAVRLGWEGKTWDVKLGEPVDAPIPYWEVAKNAIKRDFTNFFETDRRTGVLQCTREDVEMPVFSIVDHGDVPGTENLPDSYMHYFQAEARKNTVFKNLGRPMLIRIMHHLHGQLPADYFDGKDQVTIRMMIARSLGPEFDEVINAELYDAVA